MDRSADLNVLCWEGYEHGAILGAFARQQGITAHGETLVSDAGTAKRLADGDAPAWDVINLNNPFARDYLHPRGLIRSLASSRFDPLMDNVLPWLTNHLHWTLSQDGKTRIGIGQRFGPFNFVVNTACISRDIAEDEGFALTRDPGYANRYAILHYDDFNIHHICIDAGLDPFVNLTTEQVAQFEETARRWYGNARVVTSDHLILNRALLDGEIDFYLSGGLFTAAAARLDGNTNIRCITPRKGPIDGKGGIAFFEVTSVLDHTETSAYAEDFLAYVLEPDVARIFAFEIGGCNPIAQLGDPACLAGCTAEQLDAVQWDTLEEDVSRAAQYALTPDHDALLAILDSANHAADWD